MIEPIAVTVPEAVKISGLGRTTIYKMFGTGQLKPRKNGKRTLILVDELKRCLQSLPTA